MLVGVMAPYEAGFYLSRGNETTCKIQGFMIQLGQTTSMFYNLFLSLYFFLVIVYGWREHRFKKLSWAVHAIVLVFGIGLSGGSIPYIEAQFGVCGILPPLTSNVWQLSLFYTAPVSLVLVVLTASTAGICHSVYKQQQKARKWKFGKKSLAITREVFWQSFWYVSAFYVTLPLMLLSYYVPFVYPRDFWIFVVTAILAPLQGLMNSLVYFQRAKLFQKLTCLSFLCRKCKRQQSEEAEKTKKKPKRARPSSSITEGTTPNLSIRRQQEPSRADTELVTQSGRTVPRDEMPVEEDEKVIVIDTAALERSDYDEDAPKDEEGVMEYWALNEEDSLPNIFNVSFNNDRSSSRHVLESSGGSEANIFHFGFNRGRRDGLSAQGSGNNVFSGAFTRGSVRTSLAAQNSEVSIGIR